MSAFLSSSDLKEVLKKLLLEMQNKNMLAPNLTLDLDAMAEKITKTTDVSQDKIKSADFKNTLCLCLISAAIEEKQPGIQFDYTNFFSGKPMPQLKAELKDDLTKLFKAMFTLTPDSKLDDKKLDKLIDNAIDDVMKNFKEQNEPTLAENAKTMSPFELAFSLILRMQDHKQKQELDPNQNSQEKDPIEESRSAFLRSLFGVDDRYGNAAAPVQVFLGTAGIADKSGQGNASSFAIIDRLFSPNTSEVDSQGIKNTIRYALEEVTETIGTAPQYKHH